MPSDPIEKEVWSKTPGQLRDVQNEFIEKRWRQLAEAVTLRLDAAVNYLMLTNAGGAVATLSFMGAMKTISPFSGAPFALGLFLAGISFVGILRAIHYYRFAWLFRCWRDDVAGLFKDQMSWRQLIARDTDRSGWFVVADVVGWLSFACFVVGVAIGYVGMFDIGSGK